MKRFIKKRFINKNFETVFFRNKGDFDVVLTTSDFNRDFLLTFYYQYEDEILKRVTIDTSFLEDLDYPDFDVDEVYETLYDLKDFLEKEKNDCNGDYEVRFSFNYVDEDDE